MKTSHPVQPEVPECTRPQILQDLDFLKKVSVENSVKNLNIPSTNARIVSDLLKALAILSETTGAATKYLDNVLENETFIFL